MQLLALFANVKADDAMQVVLTSITGSPLLQTTYAF
jgi:hypothetical protein